MQRNEFKNMRQGTKLFDLERGKEVAFLQPRFNENKVRISTIEGWEKGNNLFTEDVKAGNLTKGTPSVYIPNNEKDYALLPNLVSKDIYDTCIKDPKVKDAQKELSQLKRERASIDTRIQKTSTKFGDLLGTVVKSASKQADAQA